MTAFHSEALEELLQVLAKLQDPKELDAFLEDLCTIKELQDMAQRFQTAKLLAEGKNYQEVTAGIGTSTATISRVNKCLQYGQGGYRLALELLKEDRTNAD